MLHHLQAERLEITLNIDVLQRFLAPQRRITAHLRTQIVIFGLGFLKPNMMMRKRQRWRGHTRVNADINVQIRVRRLGLNRGGFVRVGFMNVGQVVLVNVRQHAIQLNTAD